MNSSRVHGEKQQRGREEGGKMQLLLFSIRENVPLYAPRSNMCVCVLKFPSEMSWARSLFGWLAAPALIVYLESVCAASPDTGSR